MELTKRTDAQVTAEADVNSTCGVLHANDVQTTNGRQTLHSSKYLTPLG